MSVHFLAVHYESYDSTTVFGIFSTFIAARDHIEAEARKPGASTAERLAIIEEWDGPACIATHERDWVAPQIWNRRESP